jgi:hypothetical protein
VGPDRRNGEPEAELEQPRVLGRPTSVLDDLDEDRASRKKSSPKIAFSRGTLEDTT